MMLYVFHVDVGRMMNFDMTVALSSVENLKATIERHHSIPATNIVLLVSGGEMLTESTQVSYYSAGTDTNPIYMFLTGETRLPPPVMQSEPDLDLTEQVDRCKQLPHVYASVEKRAQLAQKMYDLARDEERLSERLVHEQHLQQQGWSAVVANMEDLTDEFRQRFRDFCAAFDRHLEQRSTHLELLHNFNGDLKTLSRIPILPGLMPLAEEDFHGFDKFLDGDDVFSRSGTAQSVLMAGGVPVTASAAAAGESGARSGQSNTAEENAADDKSSTSPNKKLKMGNETSEEAAASSDPRTVVPLQSSSTSSTRRHELNLLQWITSKENQNRLTIMCNECVQGLNTFNNEVYAHLKNEVQHLIKQAEQSDVKEIKGLSDRLCKLEEFKYKIKKMVQDQKELSTAFQQNQNRAINLRDASILPDLCASHQSQLGVMLSNHQKIHEYRRIIAKAKDELGINLHMRLNRIVLVENNMSSIDNRLLFYHRCLRRAERHIKIIEQIHQAPCIYVAAVTEVVRRKIFSGEFRLWGSKLAEDFDTIHSEEVSRRQLFNASFEGHFLNILFPGMNDMPPAFANETPLIFDARLPNITKSDIDLLSSHLPDLASDIQLPDMGPVINFFVSRSGPHQKDRMEELLRQQVAAALGTTTSEVELQTSGGNTAEKPLQHPRLSDLKVGIGCDDSLTDTETEFEKVPATETETETALTQVATVSTSTSENHSAPPEMVERSAATSVLLMQSAETLTEETEQSRRAEVERLRDILSSMYKLSTECIQLSRIDLNHCRTDAATYGHDLLSEIQMLNEKWSLLRMQCEEREQQVLQENMQLISTVQQRESDLGILRQRLCDAETVQLKCDAMEEQLQELQGKVKSLEVEKENAVTAVRDELIHEHKTQIESLRCRYKLMTSMEHSPSETMAEKLERPSSNIENMIERTEHDAMLAEMRANFEAEKEKAIATALDNERTIWQSKFNLNSESVMTNVSILKDMIEDKERQLDLMREKDLMLTKENYQLKTRIDALTNEEGTSWLKEKIEYLNRDKCRLEEELTMEKEKALRLEMEASVGALQASTYEQGAMALSRSKSSGSSHKFVVLDSCSKGDLVFAVWSVRHGQYMVVQDSQSLYFVHADSLPALNLRLPPTPALGESAAIENLPIPVPYYAIGRVIEKEYCQAKKDENRYRVTKGSKFYRIKLSPLVSKQSARRERVEAFSTSFRRSISQCEATHSGDSSALLPTACTAVVAVSNHPISQLLQQSHSVDSGAVGVSDSIMVREMMDCVTSSSDAALSPTFSNISRSPSLSVSVVGGGAGINSSGSSGGGGSLFKERTISITSVTEEDDEPTSASLSERCRYISVTEEEEEEGPLAAAVATTTPTTQSMIQQSVITEQPTASGNFKFDLMLTSNEATQPQQQQQEQQQQEMQLDPNDAVKPITTISTVDLSTATLTASMPLHSHGAAIPIITASGMGLEPVDAICCSPKNTSFGTASEDSDEYRSLEAKDDTDFAISE